MAAYDRSLVVSELDPEGLPAKQRLAIGLGFSRPDRLRKPLKLLAAGGLVATAAAVLLAVLLWPAEIEGPVQDDFKARSAAGQGRADSLVVYRLAADGTSVRASGAIRADAELAFAYRNPAGKKRLMVFATDETGAVYWYYPAWQSSGEDPAAVAIEPGPGLVELPEAVRHEVRGARLTVYALFTDRALRVREAERQMADSGVASLPGEDDELIEAIEVEVRH